MSDSPRGGRITTTGYPDDVRTTQLPSAPTQPLELRDGAPTGDRPEPAPPHAVEGEPSRSAPGRTTEPGGPGPAARTPRSRSTDSRPWWRSSRFWRRWVRPHMSLSRSVLGAMLVIATAGLLFSGGISYSLHSKAVDYRIDDELAQELKELRGLANSSDPNTGGPYTSVNDLLHTALERNVPNRSEEFVVLIDGKVPFVSAAPRPMRLERSTELRSFIQALDRNSDARYGTITHSEHTVRFMVAPVIVPGDPATGMFVAAVDVTAERSNVNSTVQAQLLAGTLTLLLIAGVGALVFRWLLRPLGELARAAERINDAHLDERVPERGADDLALLARTVNGMLDRLDRAFSMQRALLDDVGHELRTPLTVLRGHLEIMDSADAEDVTATRELLLDEIDRMGRLVDELVLLAKSERPDFLVPAPLDVDDVVEGAMTRAVTLADRQYRVDGRSETVITGDRQRLTQALLQLLSNAIRYTTADDQIALGSRVRDETHVEVWVRDTGLGIDPAHHERIFERFERGGAPVSDDPGETRSHNSGLGLSIVAAIAKAHGGHVELVSAPGRGSTFTLVLPLEPPTSTPREAL